LILYKGVKSLSMAELACFWRGWLWTTCSSCFLLIWIESIKLLLALYVFRISLNLEFLHNYNVKTYMLFDSLLIENWEALVVFHFFNSRFLYLERTLACLRLIQPIESCRIFLEKASLTTNWLIIKISSIEFGSVSLEKLTFSLGQALITDSLGCVRGLSSHEFLIIWLGIFFSHWHLGCTTLTWTWFNWNCLWSLRMLT